jgi:hypothetical protein
MMECAHRGKIRSYERRLCQHHADKGGFRILQFLKSFFIVMAVLLAAIQGLAADLGAPRLSDPIAVRSFFDPDRFLTTGGVSFSPDSSFTIEPRIGVGYRARAREFDSGVAEVLHKVHAEAGGRIGLGKDFHLSAVAKLPVYTYEISDRRTANIFDLHDPVSRHAYELFRRPASAMSWTGEMELRLGDSADLSIYYDQTMFPGFAGAGSLSQSEERFGTRIIFKFK